MERSASDRSVRYPRGLDARRAVCTLSGRHRGDDPGRRDMTTDDEGASAHPARRRVTLTGISSRAWEHPADRGALTALRELRGFDDVLKAFNGMWNERGFAAGLPGRAIRVDHRQYPRVYRALRRGGDRARHAGAARAVRAQSTVDQRHGIGMAKPFIVINTAAVALLDDDELRCLLGHELGHLVSGHAVYRTMLMILTGWAATWLAAGRLDRAAGDHRGDDGVVAQGGAVRRPGRAARHPGPGGVAAAADEAGRRRRPVSRSTRPRSWSRPPSTTGGGDLRDSLHQARG